MDMKQFRGIIAFCVLMQANGGILTKAPSYVMEKFDHPHPAMLDDINLATYREYFQRWVVHLDVAG